MREYAYEERFQEFLAVTTHKSYTGWVYIIGTKGHPYFKIGMAKNVGKRRSSIQGGSPWLLTVIRKYHTSDNELIEAYLHKLFEHKRFYNEWFELDENDFHLIDMIEGFICNEN